MYTIYIFFQLGDDTLTVPVVLVCISISADMVVIINRLQIFFFQPVRYSKHFDIPVKMFSVHTPVFLSAVIYSKQWLSSLFVN